MTTPRELVFLDVETTGVDLGGRLRLGVVSSDVTIDPIVEIAVARIDVEDRRVLDAYVALVRPWHMHTGDGRPWFCEVDARWVLADDHPAVDALRAADWSNSVPVTDAYGVLLDRFLRDGAVLCGQGLAAFDLPHLRRDFVLLGLAWPRFDRHIIDLASMAAPAFFCGEVEGVSLRHTAPWARGEAGYRQRHRAAFDVRDAVDVFFAFLDRGRPLMCAGPCCHVVAGWPVEFGGADAE